MSSYDAAIAILAGPAAAGSSKAAASSLGKPDASSKASPDTSTKSDDGLISPLAALALVVAGLGGWALYQRGKAAEEIETEGSEILSASPAGWAALNATEYPRADNPAAWVQDEDIWERAKAEVLPDWGRYDQPWAVVTHVYEQMGGRIAAA